jgi:arylsulfatase A-like enzyme
MPSRREFLATAGAAAASCALPAAGGAARRPNVILVLADDLGYGELGSYGQKRIRTPNLDRLAAEGTRFTQAYAGSPVCAPSRAVLMTGLHTGHVCVRGNAGKTNPEYQQLRAEEATVARLFKSAGYRTALFGKWGLGEIGTAGHPNAQGFDEFFGYLNQTHAHNYYPSFLVHNSERVPLANVPEQETPAGAGYARVKAEYSHDVIMEKALAWLERNRRDPFFLYLAVTLPHANNEATRATGNGQEVPDDGDYAKEPWTAPNKGQAAMISRLDRDVGRLVERLARWGLERDTLVIFTSDNGHHSEGGNDPEFFDANGPLRGMKRSLYEGGIRVPFIARWPGKVPRGAVSPHVLYFGDLHATFSDLVGRPRRPGLDSVSVLPALTGRANPERHEFLYWEFYEQGGRQAVRFGDWKAVRQPIFTGPIEIYDLASDVGEQHDLAASRPDLVKEAAALMARAHVPDPRWVPRG